MNPLATHPKRNTAKASKLTMSILGLAAGSSAKQIYWKLMINDTNMTSGFSTAICAYNTLLNTLNTGLAFWAVTSQVPADQGSFLSSLTTAPTAA